MWQRIQTLYIGIATALTAVMFFSRMATIIAPAGEELDIMYYEKIPYLIMLIMLLTAGICAAFCFKNWFLQARVCMLTALILTGFQIWLGVDFFMYREEMIFSVTMLFPMAAAILDLMAAKRIMTDEFILKTYKKMKRKR